MFLDKNAILYNSLLYLLFDKFHLTIHIHGEISHQFLLHNPLPHIWKYPLFAFPSDLIIFQGSLVQSNHHYLTLQYILPLPFPEYNHWQKLSDFFQNIQL